MLDAKLVVVGGTMEKQEIVLDVPLVIGRGSEADLVVADGLVSRRHAEIFEQNGRLFVKDLGSLNGTFINNQRIVEAQALDSHQLLTLGTVTFRAIYGGQTEGESNGTSRPQDKQLERETVRFSAGVQDTVSLPEPSAKQPTEARRGLAAPGGTLDTDSAQLRASLLKTDLIVNAKPVQAEAYQQSWDDLSDVRKIPR